MPEQSRTTVAALHLAQAGQTLAEAGQELAEAAQRFSIEQQDAAEQAQHVAEQAQRVAEYRQRLAEAAQEVAEAARADAEAEQERLTEFLAIAAHELKGPLTPIAGYLQLITALLATESASAKAHQYTLRAWEQVERLKRLMNDLLDVSRVGVDQLTLQRASCDLSAVVRAAVETRQVVWPGRTVTLEAPPKPVPVVADADRLGQVVTNYLTNALTYSPADRPVAVRLAVHGDEARVEVRDEGPGLAPEAQERIWQRFQRDTTTTPPGGGLGLGLYISHSIIERHGGTVGLESTVGEGATFSFTLPVPGCA